ncbi:AraC family transcriptional regulator [Ralstonia soli]|uniref:AraC family transcriptional regulator n=1 Tax=Ralstonia soli TaxID=2953896 RepID=A0ABT1AGH1_9RALS|nr:AraC family transcriptional regulator [Ralstonia soli]MCO5397419.1 AraC family transcriptional regulator [Ralstonia soli]
MQSHFPIRLHRLLPAFPWLVTQTSGRTVIRRRGFERLLVPGQQLILQPFEAVEVLLDGDYAQASVCTFEVQSDGLVDLQEASLYQGISQRVFLQPQHTWDASHVSELLDVPALKVRAKLFSQGYALTDICRTQRLMRALFELTHGGSSAAGLKPRIGWPMHGDLETAFHDRLGVSLTAARHLSTSVSRSRIETLAVFPPPARRQQQPVACD